MFDDNTWGIWVDWQPEAPRFESRRAGRKFFAAYAKARADFLRDVATMIGGSVVVFDTGDAVGEMAVIKPEVRH